MDCWSISLNRPTLTRGLPATRRSPISTNHPSGSLRTQVFEEEAGNVITLEKLEYYLKLAKDTTEGVQEMFTSLKFNVEQCEYLVDKLKVVIQSATSFLEVSRGKLHGGFSSEGGIELVELFKLVVALAKQTESFFKGCSKDAWIQAAMTLTIVSDYVSSLGFNMELCRVAFCKDCASIRCLALGEVADINRAETEIVEKKAGVDWKSLVRKVTLELNSLCGEERDLASYLLQRLLRVESNPTSEDGSRLGKLFHWVIPGEQLGRSASAVVHKAMWLATPVAKKTFDGAENSDFMKEVEILARLCHPNITSMFCSSKNMRKCSIIMELMDEDLDRLMQRRCKSSDSPPFPILEAIDIMLQIGEGVSYLHSQGIVHRDLKSMNILVKNVKAENIEIGYVHAKVADFGLSKTKESTTTYSNQTPNVGSTRWMPPEIMKLTLENQGFSSWFSRSDKLPNHPFKCDTYSFGMVCYEILTGHVPFSNNNNPNDVKKRVLKDRERPSLPSDCPLKLKALIEKCWAHEPKERPKFGVICEELKYLKYLLMTAESKNHLQAVSRPDVGDGTTKEKQYAPAIRGSDLGSVVNRCNFHQTRQPGRHSEPGKEWDLLEGSCRADAGQLSTGNRIPPSHRPDGGTGIELPPKPKQQDPGNQPATSSHGDRNGSRETDVHHIPVPPLESIHEPVHLPGYKQPRDVRRTQDPRRSPKKGVGLITTITKAIDSLKNAGRSNTPPPQRTSNGPNYPRNPHRRQSGIPYTYIIPDTSTILPPSEKEEDPRNQHASSGHGDHSSSRETDVGPSITLPPFVKQEDPRNQPASSSHGDRNGSSEKDGYHIRAPPPGSYQDDDTGPSPKNLVMAVMGVKSAVNHFAKALISDMIKYPKLRHLDLRIRKEVHGEVDRKSHWMFVVRAFVCKRLFEGFETENGFFGIEYFDELKTSSASSFNDFSTFKDKAGTISLLLAKDSADLSFLGKFCFKKFKSISGGSLSNQPLPCYEEEWSMIERERHPRSEFYQSFLKVAVSVWLLHRLVYSFEQGWSMLGWESFPQGCKFERMNMESVVPGGFEEGDEETGTDVNTVVGFLVIPGFQVSKSVVKCEVYLRNKNNLNEGKIMVASEVPSRDKSLEKSFSDKTPVSFQTLEKSLSARSHGSLQTPDSFKSSSNYSGYSSRAAVDVEASGNHLSYPQVISGRSGMVQGRSPGSKSGHLEIRGRGPTTRYLSTQEKLPYRHTMKSNQIEERMRRIDGMNIYILKSCHWKCASTLRRERSACG